MSCLSTTILCVEKAKAICRHGALALGLTAISQGGPRQLDNLIPFIIVPIACAKTQVLLSPKQSNKVLHLHDPL